MIPTIDVRIQWLRSLERMLREHADELCTLVSSEIGKSDWDVFSCELMPLLAAIRWHRRHLKRLLRPRKIRGGAIWQISQRATAHRIPVGTVGIIATWNYPLQLLGVQLVQALAAGNDVVVKPSEHAPRSQQRLLELAIEAGLPPGRLRWTEATREAGARFLEETRLDHLLFTGSSDVGREVAAACAERMIPSTLELSGRDTALVLDDADLKLAARSIWHAVVMNAGQTCMAPRRVLVMSSVYKDFIRELTRIAAAARPVSLVRCEDLERCLGLVHDAVEAGGRAILSDVDQIDGHGMRPQAVVDCPHGADLVQGHHFGPVVAVLKCTDLEQALDIHAGITQKLATAVYTRGSNDIESLAPLFRSGIVSINDAVLPAGHPGVTISGQGESGWGSSQGAEGLLQLTRPMVLTRTGRLFRVPLEVPTDRAQRFIRRLILGASRNRRSHPEPTEALGDSVGRPAALEQSDVDQAGAADGGKSAVKWSPSSNES